MIDVLHLSNTPLSNAPANLCTQQNKYGINATLLLHQQQNVNKVFVGGELHAEYSSDQLVEMFEKARVIHFHNFAFEQKIFETHPHLIEIAKKKPCLIQYHSARNSVESFENTINDPFFAGRRAVVAQYQVRQYPEAEYVVPNVIPIYDSKYMPIKARWTQTRLMTFAPSNTHLKGWDYKGYDQVRGPLKEIAKRTGYIVDVIRNEPYDNCLAMKRWSHIGMEEIVTGSYHLSFLEYMSMGCATFGHMDEETKLAMAKIVGNHGVRVCPYIDATPKSLEEKVIALISMGAAEPIGDDCRTWMENFWNPKDHVKRFEEIYAKI